MTDGQRLMVGLLLALGLLLAAPAAARRERLRWLGLLLLIGVGLVVNLKRGSWICTAGVAGAFLVVRAGWRYAVLVLAVALSLLAVPTVRTRLAGLREELSERGGRMTMWTKIAPVLVREHPWGIGYRALTNDMMRRIVPTVERDRDHLHSNPVQILVESGWLGLAVYLVWMGRGVGDAWRRHRELRGDASLGTCALALCFALIALLANGLVEYNMGDAEIVLAYGFMLGAVGSRAARERTTVGR
jgi:O-antigen ligase